MGNHKSKENGYMQMGARLYNAETGRFMSVDPLMEIFTGHSPYHYSYNNPVMFSDPSGLAPEGEKDNKVQAPGDDAIGGSITSGYWTTRVSYSYNEYYTKNLDDPMGPRGRTFHSDLVVSTEDVFVNGSGGGGGGGGGVAPSASRTGSINRSTSRKVYKTSLDKSMRDQNYVMKNNNNNTLFMTKDAANQMKVFFGINVGLGEPGPIDLFEVTSVTDMFPNDNKNYRYINYLREMINNNIEPVALSGTQKYNFSKSNNVHTPSNSSYGMRTAFYDASFIDRYLSVNGRAEHNVGQVIAHEFFGHLFQHLLSSVFLGDEISAMFEENMYIFLFGGFQRKSYGYERGVHAVPPYAPIIE